MDRWENDSRPLWKFLSFFSTKMPIVMIYSASNGSGSQPQPVQEWDMYNTQSTNEGKFLSAGVLML